MGDPNKITGLVRTEGKTRVYQMDDGSIETREGGTVSWQNTTLATSSSSTPEAPTRP